MPMLTLPEYRSRYGQQVEHLSDDELMTQLHKQQFSTMPFDEFATKFSGERTWGEFASDQLANIAQAGVGLVGMGAGAAATLGISGADKLAEATNYARDQIGERFHSDALKRKQAGLSAAADGLNADGTEQGFFENAGETLGYIAENPEMLADLTMQNIGALVGGAAVGIGTKGSALALGAYQTLLGAGDGYSSTQERILQTPFEKLAENSDKFIGYIQEGLTPDEARFKLADDAAQVSGYIAGSISGILSKFGGVALEKQLGQAANQIGTRVAAGEAAKAFGKEITSEGLEEMGVQFAGNTAVKYDGVDEDQSLTEGLGGAGALGMAASVVPSAGMGGVSMYASRDLPTQTELDAQAKQAEFDAKANQLAEKQAEEAATVESSLKYGDALDQEVRANLAVAHDTEAKTFVTEQGKAMDTLDQLMPQDPELRAMAERGVPVVEIAPEQSVAPQAPSYVAGAADIQPVLPQETPQTPIASNDITVEPVQPEIKLYGGTTPFKTVKSAQLGQTYKTTPNARIVPVEGGYGVVDGKAWDEYEAAVLPKPEETAYGRKQAEIVMAENLARNPRLVEAGIEEMQGVETPELPMPITEELDAPPAPILLPENFTDERLADDAYRTVLGDVMDQSMKGGGVQLIAQQGTGYTGGDGNEYGQQVTRTKSMNHPITQALVADGYQAEEVRNALDAALKGQKLGKRWQGLVAKALDYSNTDAADIKAQMGEFEQAKAADIAPENLGYGDAVNAPFAPDNAQPVTMREQAMPRGAEGGIKYSFAGQKAKTANLENRATAEQMLADGVDADTVWKQTGWEKGTDGQWKFEIDDSGAELKGFYDDTNVSDYFSEIKSLGDILIHPAIYSAYPNISRIDVMSKAGSGANFGTDFTIRIGRENKNGDVLSILLHEIQHAIQQEENFARGGSPDEFTSDEAKKAELVRDALRWAKEIRQEKDGGSKNADIMAIDNNLAQWYRNEGMADFIPSREARDLATQPFVLYPERYDNPQYLTMKELVNTYGLDKEVTPLNAMDIYKRLAGETEARNTQARLTLGAEARRNTSPRSTEDVARDKQIVRFEGGRAEFAPSTPKSEVNTLKQELAKSSDAKRLMNSGKVEVVQSVDDLPAEISEQVKRSVAPTGDTIMVDGVERSTRNSNGQLIAQTEQGIINFWRWFGDSKVVDENGKPLVVYHGTGADFDTFEKSKIGTNFNVSTLGFYFTNAAAPDPLNGFGYGSTASEYAENSNLENKNVMPVYLNIKNPQEIDSNGYGGSVPALDIARSDLLRWARNEGNDGIISQDSDEDGDAEIAFVAFNSSQIKSAIGNNGNFDPNDNRFLYSKNGKTQGLFDPATNKTYLIADNLSAADAMGVLTHEVGVHAWFNTANSEKKAALEKRAVSLLKTRGLASGGLRTFLDSVQQRMVDAEQVNDNGTYKDNEEAVAYIVEEAINQFADIRYLLNDNKLLDAIGKKSKTLANFIADVITYLKSGMHKLGWMDTQKLTAGDLVAIAKGNMREVAQNDVGVNDGMLAGDVADYDGAAKYSKQGNQTNNAQPIFTVPEFGLLGKAQQKLQNNFNRIAQIQDAIVEQGGKVDATSNVYKTEERFWGKVGSKAERFTTEMKQLITSVADANITLEDMESYLYARHAIERNEFIRNNVDANNQSGSGMTDKEASDVMASMILKHPKIMALADSFDAMTLDTRKMQLEAGLISKQTFDAWNEYKHYVPLKGWADKDGNQMAEFEASRTPAKKGFDVRGAESKKAKGRNTLAAELIENMYQQRLQAIVRAGQNDIGAALFNLVNDNPNSDLWEINAIATSKKQNKSDLVMRFATQQERDDWVQDSGYSGVQLGQVGNAFTATVKDVPTMNVTATVDKGNDTLVLKVGGREVYIKIKDKPLLEQMRQAGVSSEIHPILKPLAVTQNWLKRFYTSLNPEFSVINFARDLLTAFVSMPRDTGNYLDSVKFLGNLTVSWQSMKYAWQKDGKKISPLLQRYLDNGGSTGFMDFQSVESITTRIDDMWLMARNAKDAGMKDKARTYSRMAWNTTLGVIEKMNEGLEITTRLAAFKTAIDAGKTDAEAASIAKNITVNFNRKGDWAKQLDLPMMFFNPAIQGTKRVAELMSDSKSRNMLMGLVALGFMTALIGGDEEDKEGNKKWDVLSDERKMKTLPFGLGGDMFATVQMPYGVNFFTNIGYALADVKRWYDSKGKHGKSPEEAAEFTLKSAALHLNSFGGMQIFEGGLTSLQAVMPAVIDPVIQVGDNKSWAGKKLRPEQFDAVKEEMTPDSQKFYAGQEDNIETRIAGWLSRVTGGDGVQKGFIEVAPSTINVAMSSAFGGLWNVGKATATTVAKAANPNEEVEAKDIPVVRKLVGGLSSGDYSAAYREKAEEIKTALGTYDAYVKDGDFAKAREYYRENLYLIEDANTVKADEKQLKTLRTQRNMIFAQKSLTEEQRRDRLTANKKQTEQVLMKALKAVE